MNVEIRTFPDNPVMMFRYCGDIHTPLDQTQANEMMLTIAEAPVAVYPIIDLRHLDGDIADLVALVHHVNNNMSSNHDLTRTLYAMSPVFLASIDVMNAYAERTALDPAITPYIPMFDALHDALAFINAYREQQEKGIA